MNAIEFLKTQYYPEDGEDLGMILDHNLKLSELVELMEDYAQMKVNENIVSQYDSNDAVAICPKCGAEETAFDVNLNKSKCMICQHTW